MRLFRSNVFPLPLQLSIFDEALLRLVPYLSRFLSIPLKPFFKFDYESGNFYLDRSALEKIKVLLGKKIDRGSLEELKRDYLQAENVLRLDTRQPTSRPADLKVRLDHFLDYAKYPLFNEILPELLLHKFQQVSSLSSQILLRLIRPPIILSRQFCEQTLKIGCKLLADDTIRAVLQQRRYASAVQRLKKLPPLQKCFARFLAEFYGYGSKRWDLPGCESTTHALRMIHESISGLKVSEVQEQLHQAIQERNNHQKFLSAQISLLTPPAQVLLGYLWFFQAVLDRETFMQRRAFLCSLKPMLATLSTKLVAQGYLTAKEDILFAYVNEIRQHRYNLSQIEKRKRHYGRMIQETNDPGNLDFFNQ